MRYARAYHTKLQPSKQQYILPTSGRLPHFQLYIVQVHGVSLQGLGPEASSPALLTRLRLLMSVPFFRHYTLMLPDVALVNMLRGRESMGPTTAKGESSHAAAHDPSQFPPSISAALPGEMPQPALRLSDVDLLPVDCSLRWPLFPAAIPPTAAVKDPGLAVALRGIPLGQDPAAWPWSCLACSCSHGCSTTSRMLMRMRGSGVSMRSTKWRASTETLGHGSLLMSGRDSSTEEKMAVLSRP